MDNKLNTLKKLIETQERIDETNWREWDLLDELYEEKTKLMEILDFNAEELKLWEKMELYSHHIALEGWRAPMELLRLYSEAGGNLIKSINER